MLESLYWQQLSLTRASWISQWSTKTLTYIGTTPGFESQWRKICMSVQRWALIPFPTHFKTMEAIFETPLYVNTLNVYFGVGQKWTSYTIAILFTFYCNNNITLTHSWLIDTKLHVNAVFLVDCDAVYLHHTNGVYHYPLFWTIYYTNLHTSHLILPKWSYV